MSEVTKYLDCLKEIKTFSKDLDSSIVTALVNQIGVDFRLKKDIPTKSETKEPITFIPATDSQVRVLKERNLFKEGLSKSEAWKLISDSKNKKEQDY